MSLVVAEKIELQTHDRAKVIQLVSVQKFTDGSGYRCDLHVCSGGFSCDRPFYFDDVALADALGSIQRMMSGMAGHAIIKGEWETDFLRLESNEMGHVVVSGEITEHSEYQQCLVFSFRTDQTILGPLNDELRRLQDA